MLRALTVFVALFLSSAVFGQTVQYNPPVTRGHLPYWVTNGVIADGGSAADSPITTIGATGPICSNSARQSSGAWISLCLLAAANSAATISLQNYGSAQAQGLNFDINGTIVSIPTGGGTFIFGNGPFTVGDVPCFQTTGGVIQDCGLGLNNGTIYKGVWQGTPVAVAYGGTGATSAGAAQTNLGLGTMAVQNANNVAITGGSITGQPTPVNPTDVAIKSYVDATATGLTILAPSALATATVLPNTPTYSNGTSGVGATLTAGTNSTLTVDGTVAALNTVVLVKNQVSAFQNGIYTVTTAGSGSAAWVLTRATYFDTSANMLAGSYTLVTGGSLNVNASYVLQTTIATVGTSDVNFVQFSQVSNGVTSLCTLNGAITAMQATACLNQFTSSLQGMAPASGGGTTNFLRADGSWTVPASSTPGGVSGDLQTNNGAGGFSGVSHSSASANQVLTYNGSGGYIWSSVVALLNAGCTLAPSACGALLGYYNVKWFGATGNLQSASASCSASSPLVTSGGSVFVPGDAGKRFLLVGAGSAGALLVATISLYISPTQVDLNTNCLTSVTSVGMEWFTDDTTAINSAVSAARSNSYAFFPCGNYSSSGVNATNWGGGRLSGAGSDSACAVIYPNGNFNILVDETGSAPFITENFQLGGPFALGTGNAILVHAPSTTVPGIAVIRDDHLFVIGHTGTGSCYFDRIASSELNNVQCWQYSSVPGTAALWFTNNNDGNISSSFTPTYSGAENISDLSMFQVEAHGYAAVAPAPSNAIHIDGGFILRWFGGNMDCSNSSCILVQADSGVNPDYLSFFGFQQYSENGTPPSAFFGGGASIMSNIYAVNVNHTYTSVFCGNTGGCTRGAVLP